MALEASRADRRDPRWLHLLTVVAAVVMGPLFPVPVLVGVACLVVGMVLMAQAPKTTRRWGVFVLRGLLGSLAIAELGFSVGGAAAAMLASVALAACWIANAHQSSRADRSEPLWLRLLTIAAAVAVVPWPFVFLALKLVFGQDI